MEALRRSCRVMLRGKKTTQLTTNASCLRAILGNNNSIYSIPSRGFRSSTALTYPQSGGANADAKKAAADQTSSDIRILRELSQHLWPSSKQQPNATALKARVVASVSLLIASKIVNIQVPFLFKALVDSFDMSTLVTAAGASAGTSGTPVDTIILVSPLVIVLGYGVARSAAAAAAELRSAIFATVAHDAIRQVSRNVFVHLHNLDMQFHLERNTGTLFVHVQLCIRVWACGHVCVCMCMNVHLSPPSQSRPYLVHTYLVPYMYTHNVHSLCIPTYLCLFVSLPLPFTLTPHARPYSNPCRCIGARY